MKLLVATDFSEVGNNAVRYASAWANEYNFEICIFNAFSIPINISDTEVSNFSLPLIEELKSIKANELKQLANEIKAIYPKLTLTKKVVYGEFSFTIEDVLNEEAADLLFLGNSGENKSTLWVGSNVLSAFRTLSIPVFVIPHNYHFKPITKLGMAIEPKDLMDFSFDKIKKMVSISNAHLDLITVVPTDHSITITSAQETNILNQFNQVALTKLESDDANQALLDYMGKSDLEGLIIAPKDHSLFYNLIHKSHTKHLLQFSNLPLISIH